jgi:hypothetical protein
MTEEAQENTLPYTPGPDQFFIYTVSVPVTQVFTSIVITDAPEEYTKEILMASLKEQSEETELLEFRAATPEEINQFQEMYGEPPVTVN